jgi:hypothetical protein
MNKKEILIKLAKDFALGIPLSKETAEIPTIENKKWEYVFHKHKTDRDNRTHYDIRILNPEINKLHSFVVRTLPKKGEKILANRTFDHRGNYIDFKGKISKGYGKGIVRQVGRGQATIKSSSPNKITFITHDAHPKKYSLIHTDGKKWLMIQSKLAEDLQSAKSKTLEYLKQLRPHAYKMSVVGSISRGHENVNDADIVVWPKKSFRENVQLIGQTSGGDKMLRTEYKKLPINIWLADKKSYEPTRYHFSRGKGIIHDKLLAKQKNMKLTRYGLQDRNQLHTKEKKIKTILEKN